MPDAQAIDGDGQQLDVQPVCEFADAIAQIGGQPYDLVTKES